MKIKCADTTSSMNKYWDVVYLHMNWRNGATLCRPRSFYLRRLAQAKLRAKRSLGDDHNYERKFVKPRDRCPLGHIH